MAPVIGPMLAQTLVETVDAVRDRLGDPLAKLAFMTPVRANGEQVRRLLGASGRPFIHIEFITADQVVTSIGQMAFLEQGRVPEPADWLNAQLSVLLPRLAAEGRLGPHGSTLSEPGWRAPLQSALNELQSAGVTAGMLLKHADEAALGPRFSILATLLQEVQAARRESGIFVREEVERMALERIQHGLPHPINDIEGVIVLGDALLSPRVFTAAKAWLAQRDVTRVEIPPLNRVPAAPRGLRLAAGDCRVRQVGSPPGRLGHLQRGLFAPRLERAEPDGSLELVSTPDEIREMAEVARRVQAAVAQGVALDRVAVVLPDADQAHVLEAELTRAGIPAVWLTGPSLARTGAASFLALAMDIANGEQSAERWYDLLTQPGLQNVSWVGRTRWRGLLAGCVSDTGEGIASELEAMASEAGDEEDERGAARAKSARALASVIGGILEAMEELPRQGTLGTHGRAWKAFLERWWRKTPDRERVSRLLDGWGPGQVGALLARTAASGLLRESLGKSPFLKGSLTQAAVRVLPPMLLLGGEFDLVCVTGMTEGRFPRAPRENVLLTDAMIERLRQDGALLVGASDRQEVERRRLAAVVGGACKTLWMASPKFEMLEGKPCLPSSLLLTVLSAVEGRRVSYSELEGTLRRRGSRSKPVPWSEAEALGAAEFLLARTVHRGASMLPVLGTHTTARRLMQLERSVDRCALSGQPDAWTGLVPPQSMPTDLREGLQLSPWELTQWVFDPLGFFYARVLGVRGARRLRARAMTRWSFEGQVLEAVKEAMQPGEGSFEERYESGWTRRLRQSVEQGRVDQDGARVWEEMGRRTLQRMMQAHGGVPSGEELRFEGEAIHPSLPVTLSGGQGWVEGERLVNWWSGDVPAIKMGRKRYFQLMAMARARELSGSPVTEFVVTGASGQSRRDVPQRYVEEFERMVESGMRRTQQGWWPAGGSSRFGLAREAALDLSTMEQLLSGMEERS